MNQFKAILNIEGRNTEVVLLGFSAKSLKVMSNDEIMYISRQMYGVIVEHPEIQLHKTTVEKGLGSFTMLS